ncbi:DivIVA domain-containing protein [Nocardiopsis sp. HNM0947]|uniref:Cell wall synthesis protein Wag31 n=1 Tax=Nocardiopsis coralli TaxID=2772213 RepID=A0ABR9P4N7_9ACTN|nr:DivIVA domain-containing protein [Nocardiopsis coralli]MBE2998808.1 DivIVA domain-containing protein [Nocardiopsis coralli]
MVTMPLTPADIRDKKFHTVRFRPGYNEGDVDALLDRVEATLLALDGGPRKGELITADEVRGARFRTTRFGPGYREEEVDDFLDRIIAELAGRGLGREAQPPSGPPPLPPRPEPEPAAPPRVPVPGGPGGPGTSSPAGPRMSATSVRNKQFAITRLTTGYNEQEVDDFLDRAEFTLTMLMEGRPDRATLTATDVERVQFATTRARPGYDPEQVDLFLDALAEELRRYEGGR